MSETKTGLNLLIRKTIKRHIRGLIIGPPKTGKTTFCLSWPEPIVINFDNNSPPGVDEIPMWNPEFLDTLAKRRSTYPNVRDATLKVMRQLDTLRQGGTLILDSIGLMEASYTAQQETDPKPMVMQKDKSMIPNTQAMYGDRKVWYETILCALPRYNGNVFALVHQAQEYDDNGMQTGMIYPAISGQMKSKLAGFFNNCWQTVIRDLPNGDKAYDVRLSGSAKLGLGTSFKCPLGTIENATYEKFKPYL